jgi:hypothetical protein
MYVVAKTLPRTKLTMPPKKIVSSPLRSDLGSNLELFVASRSIYARIGLIYRFQLPITDEKRAEKWEKKEKKWKAKEAKATAAPAPPAKSKHPFHCFGYLLLGQRCSFS